VPDALTELGADVIQTGEVVARIRQAAFGFLAPLAILGDPCGFFEKATDILGARLDDARDHALLDDCVCPRPQPGAEKHIDHVLAPDMNVIDVVARITTAVEHPLDRDLRIARPLPRRPALAVIEDHLHACARHSLAGGRAVEDDVLHRLPAQRGRPRFAQHPAHRIDDVRLAAPVGTDNPYQVARHDHGRRIDEGLEAGKFEL